MFGLSEIIVVYVFCGSIAYKLSSTASVHFQFYSAINLKWTKRSKYDLQKCPVRNLKLKLMSFLTRNYEILSDQLFYFIPLLPIPLPIHRNVLFKYSLTLM